jgi:phosphopantetheine adenylyltransferase
MGAAVVAVWGAGALLHRGHRARSTTETPERSRSLVRILTSDEELEEAVSRAASFEKMVDETLQACRRRYEVMVPAGPARGSENAAPSSVVPQEIARSA